MSISTLPVGTQTITETYSGDGNFTTSNGMITQSVVISIYALNTSNPSPTLTGTVYLSGSSSIDIPGQLVVDSPAKPAVTVSGSSKIIASNGVEVAGTVSVSGSSSVGPHLTTGISAVADPLASLAVPSLTGKAVSINLTNGSETISSGIYSQIDVSGAASLKLNPGIYVISGGGLSDSGSASISGSGVTIYIAGSAYPASGGSYGGITLSGSGTINLSAASTGAYAGILFFQARTNPTTISISGSGAMTLGGVIYASDALFSASGSGSVITDGMVVNRIQLSGSAATSAPVMLSAASVPATVPVSASPPAVAVAASQAGASPESVLDELVAALLSAPGADVVRGGALVIGQPNKVAIAPAARGGARSGGVQLASVPAGPLAQLERPKQAADKQVTRPTDVIGFVTRSRGI